MKKIITILFLFLCCANIAAATEKEKLDFQSFSLIPVLHEGRIKPLDSFARITLRALSGQETLNGKTAPEWLAGVIFDPSESLETPVFTIRNPSLKDHLDLPKNKKIFTLAEIAPALDAHKQEIIALNNNTQNNMTPDQRDLLDTYEKTIQYGQILRSFSFLLPLNINVPKQYGAGNTYADFHEIANAAQKNVKALVKNKGANPEKYNDKEKTLAAFAFALDEIRANGENNNALRVIHTETEWLTPWQDFLKNKNNTAGWKSMAEAYRSGDSAAWLAAVKSAQGDNFLMKLERTYNAAAPFRSSMGFYILGIILLAAEIIRKTNRTLFPMICLGLGLAYHIGGLAARIAILQRPPVGTLYESLLFVSLICALAALAFSLLQKNFPALFAGLASSSLLLFVAPFLLQQGESMEMLVAVLNTNFWLGTHVLCITAGYGIAILSAFLAHGYLFLGLRTNAPHLEKLQSIIYKTSLLALLLTAVGTMLGGVWADQSWGRFWGWDPKENGALLIVLWLIWIQHGCIAGQMSQRTFIAATAFLNVIVALAWFGVNLLSVGLHSYGFISGIALALGIFCASEIILITILWKLGSGKNPHALA
ncbi:MAG: cytochrome c biogenesis protein CcsA [Alphaproteobacteria bacterium]